MSVQVKVLGSIEIAREGLAIRLAGQALSGYLYRSQYLDLHRHCVLTRPIPT